MLPLLTLVLYNMVGEGNSSAGSMGGLFGAGFVEDEGGVHDGGAAQEFQGDVIQH